MLHTLLLSASASAVAAAALLLPTEATPPPPSILETLKQNGNYSTLVLALETAGLDAALESNKTRLTLFAPTDDAFADVPAQDLQDLLGDIPALTQVLLYHVVGSPLFAADVVSKTTIDTLNGQRVDVTSQGPDVFIDQAKIEAVDQLASNGVIHQLDAVLFPNLLNIVETASAAGDFTSLLTAASNLPKVVDLLTSGGPFTVFAPNDAAFANVPPERLAELLKGTGASNKALGKILRAHIVGRRFYADEIAGLTEVTTISGVTLSVQVVGSDVFVGGVKIIATDVEASNGVVHVVGNVILP